MTNRSFLLGCMATLLLAVAVAAQTAAPQQQPRPTRAVPTTRAQKPAAPAPAVKPVAATAQVEASAKSAVSPWGPGLRWPVETKAEPHIRRV